MFFAPAKELNTISLHQTSLSEIEDKKLNAVQKVLLQYLAYMEVVLIEDLEQKYFDKQPHSENVCFHKATTGLFLAALINNIALCWHILLFCVLSRSWMGGGSGLKGLGDCLQTQRERA